MIRGLNEAHNSILEEVEKKRRINAKQKLLTGTSDEYITTKRDLSTQEGLILKCTYVCNTSEYYYKIKTQCLKVIVINDCMIYLLKKGLCTYCLYDFLCIHILSRFLNEGLKNELFRVGNLSISFLEDLDERPTTKFLQGIVDNEIVFIIPVYVYGMDMHLLDVYYQDSDNRLIVIFSRFSLSMDISNYQIKEIHYDNNRRVSKY